MRGSQLTAARWARQAITRISRVRFTLGAAPVLAIAAAAAVGCGSCKSGGTNAADTPDPIKLTEAERAGPKEIRALPPKVPGHPRLWVREQDLAELRSWATPENPTYAQGLLPAAEQAKQDVDQGHTPDAGDCNYKGRYCEQTALILAFMSLLATDRDEAKAYAERSKRVLIPMLTRVRDNKPGDTLAAPRFSVSDRSRWAGEAFGLTVDWIYPYLSAADKSLIRTVFLRWAEEQLKAEVTNHNHPKPIGKLNDKQLIQDRRIRRYAANNYFTAHARNLGLMSLALDAADDPAEPGAGRTYPRLRDYLQNATGAWLYMSDSVLRNDALGGIAPEGFEYAPRTLAFLLQLHLALETAGEADEERHGTQALRWKNPFWDQLVPAFLNSLSPQTVASGRSGRQIYQPAWTGDGEVYELLDFADVFAPLGISARLRGEKKLAEQARWIQRHTAAGGAEHFARRASAERGAVGYRQAILYFMLFDPKLPPAADPRPALPTHHIAQGSGRVSARESWSEDAGWVNFNCGWAEIDHQHGDAGDFSWYRKGEWLTKERIGYGEGFERSDQHNTLAIENSRPNHTEDSRRKGFWTEGSQWVLSHTRDPELTAHVAKSYVAASCDFAGMYNSAYENVNDVRVAERIFVWVKPDLIVIRDRAGTGDASRFKRFWLHTPALATVAGNRATSTTAAGQALSLTTLLPSAAKLSSRRYPGGSDWKTKPAAGEMMLFDVLVEPPAPARDVVFLHTLQAGAPLASSVFKQAAGDAVVGALTGSVAVAFREGAALERTRFRVPAATRRVLIAGLKPGAAFQAKLSPAGGELECSLEPGAGATADAAGVLELLAP